MPRTGSLHQWVLRRQKRPCSARARTDATLSARIATIHQRSRATYGAPRIHVELREQGIRVGRKRVARLLRAAGLAEVSQRRWVITTQRDRGARSPPDLVEDNFAAAAPNRWVADITYFRTWGFLYRDARCVQPTHRGLGDGDLSAHRAGAQGAQPGAAAPAGRGDSPFRPRQPIHLARVWPALRGGGRAAAHGFGRRLLHNAMCESFFAILECELLDRRSFKTRAEARMAVFDFIEGLCKVHGEKVAKLMSSS